MSELHATWNQMTIRQLPACANQCRQPKLDLMPIGMPLDADVTEYY
jgi:hypothetical protein